MQPAKSINPEVSRTKKLMARKFKRNIISGVGGWDSSLVRSAIERQTTGDFSGTGQLARKMMGDGAYSAALNKRVQSLIRSEFLMEPSEEGSPAAQLVADSILKIWYKSIPELTIKTLLKSYLNVGVAVAFVTWNQEDGTWLPCIEVYDTEFLRYDQSQCKWLYKTSGLEVEIVPNDGNWILMSEWIPGQVTGFVSQLGECWVNKKFAERDQAVGNEAHIDSICIISDNGTGTAQYESSIDDFAEEVQDKKRDRVFAVPAGFEVSFQDSMASYKPEAFSNVIDYCDKKFQISILGGNLSSDVTGGSYAAAVSHHGTEIDLTQSDEAILSTTLHEQLLTHIVEVNYGDEVAKLYTPWSRWSVKQPEDLNSIIDYLDKAKAFIGPDFEIGNMEEILTPFNIQVIPKKKTEPLI